MLFGMWPATHVVFAECGTAEVVRHGPCNQDLASVDFHVCLLVLLVILYCFLSFVLSGRSATDNSPGVL